MTEELWWVVDDEDPTLSVAGPYPTKVDAVREAEYRAGSYDPSEGRSFTATDQRPTDWIDKVMSEDSTAPEPLRVDVRSGFIYLVNDNGDAEQIATNDREVAVLSQLVALLDPLDAMERERALIYLSYRYVNDSPKD